MCMKFYYKLKNKCTTWCQFLSSSYYFWVSKQNYSYQKKSKTYSWELMYSDSPWVRPTGMLTCCWKSPITYPFALSFNREKNITGLHKKYVQPMSFLLNIQSSVLKQFIKYSSKWVKSNGWQIYQVTTGYGESSNLAP